VNEDEIRAMVRDAMARRALHEAGRTAEPDAAFREHASSALLPLARGGDQDGACLIEPSVRCSHCGYCIAYGH
jgi:hypothetical protein